MSERWYERLSPVDATFLYIEGPATPMHVGGIFVYDGRAPSYREFVDHIASRLDRIPRYRQKLAFVPLGLGRPVWVDDADFDVEYHVGHTTLLPPGGDDALKRHASRAFARALDRDRPLWELELVDGLGDDRFAVVSKTHHCVLDGIAGNSVIAETTDSDPAVRAPGRAPPFAPRPAPGNAALLAGALRDSAARAVSLARGALSPASELRVMLRDVRDGLRPLASLAWNGRAPASSLNRAVVPRRGYETTVLDLAAVRRIHSALGATVNDVLLAIVAGALGKLLEARGEPLREDLRAFVPVNVRTPGAARDAIGNQVAPVYCPLPVAERDAVARVKKVSAAMKALKKGKHVLAAMSIEHLEELAPPAVATPIANLEMVYRRFNLVVSNVPGSPTPRYMLGRKLLAFHPLIPLAARQTLSVGVHTYAGKVWVGLLADGEAADDLPFFAEAIGDGLAELVAATAPPAIAARASAPVEAPPPAVLAEVARAPAARAPAR